jgi:hypothetical protein
MNYENLKLFHCLEGETSRRKSRGEECKLGSTMQFSHFSHSSASGGFLFINFHIHGIAESLEDFLIEFFKER